MDAIEHFAEAGQHGHTLSVGRTIGILFECDIAPVVSAVFDGRLMPSNERRHGGVILFLPGQADGVAADLQRGRLSGSILNAALVAPEAPR